MNDTPNARELFLDALELAPAERREFLERACGDNAELRDEALALLAAYASSETIFDDLELQNGLAGALPATTAGDGLRELAAGARLGPYTVERTLGSGGFGTVYLARQNDPVERQVALKVLRVGLESPVARARFQAETQALARMEHPSIARIHDASATEHGVPYFAMEYVPGRSLTEFCNAHGLPLERRLQLFREVCRAVEHAHRRGVIHRDLKPSNVLVTEVDGEAVVKVIDFGIAKAVDRPFAEREQLSVSGAPLGTPAYMSPEQADGERDVDTRADVYALGALLYELLAGVPPFDARQLGFIALLKAITEEDPQVPSARQRSLGDTTQVGPLPRDLDWIAMRCLEKQRDRRYPSAESLANDVQRFLTGEPVQAAPPDVRYRIAKLVRRHRVAALAAASLLVALITGLAVSSLGWIEAREQRDRANAALLEVEQQRDEASTAADEARRQRDVAQGVTLFLKDDLLAGVRPGLDRGGRHDARLIDVVDAAAARLESGRTAARIERNTEVSASLRSMLAEIYGSLGEYERSLVHIDAAQANYAELGQGDSRVALRGRNFRAATLRNLGRYGESLELARATAARQSELLGAGDVDVLGTRLTAAAALDLTGDSIAAQSEAEEVLADLEALPDPPFALVQRAYNLLALIASANEDYPGAERYFQREYDLASAELGRQDPSVLSALSNLGSMLMVQRRFDDALERFGTAHAGLLGALGEGHPDLLRVRRNLCDALFQSGRTDEGLSDFETLLADAERHLGAGDAETIGIRSRLSDCLAALGEHERAEALARQAYEDAREHLGIDTRETGARREALLSLLYGQGMVDPDEVIALSREQLDSRRRTSGDLHPTTLRSATNHALFLKRADRYPEATALYEEFIQLAREGLGEYDSGTLGLLGGQIDMLREQRDYAASEARAREVLEGAEQAQGVSLLRLGRARARVGLALVGLERFDEARSYLGMARSELVIVAGDQDSWVHLIDRVVDSLPESED